MKGPEMDPGMDEPDEWEAWSEADLSVMDECHYADWLDQRRRERQGMDLAFLELAAASRESWCLTNPERLFYCLKTLICYCLDLRKRACHGDYPDQVEVALTASHHNSYCWSAEWLCVGYGIFRNWFFTLHQDGDSFY